MDFFEAQALAQKRTTRLVVLFSLAVLGLVAASYFAFIYFTGYLGIRATANGAGIEAAASGLAHVDLWQPGALIAVCLLTISIVGSASLYKWMQLRVGGRAVAELIDARQISPGTADLRERQLLNVVEEMAIASGVPLPGVYVIDEENGINAFAAGLTPSDAVIAVTRGTLEKLTRDELQGVIAHEFSHILNGDMRLNTRLTAVLFGILVIGLIGRGILRGLTFGRPRRGNGKQGGGAAAIAVAGLIMMVLGYVGYFFGRLIQSAVSRQREFLADASAVQFTRNPGGIVGALKKIGGYALGSHMASDRAAEIGHFFFAQGFRSSFAGLWATHPPLDVRIRALDASFDGRFFSPPVSVDVAHQPWSDVRPKPVWFGPSAAPFTPLAPHALVASVGALDAARAQRAETLAASIPASLREAVRTPVGAAVVVCGLLCSPDDPALRAKQLDLVRVHAGESISAALSPLDSDLRALPSDSRLPLLLLSPPALRQLSPADLSRLLDALDELVHADAQVSLFEFALQKVLVRHLQLAASPTSARETLSPSDLSAELSVALSFAARVSADDEAGAQQCFLAGASQFAGLYPPLAFRSADTCSLADLDAALDRLALGYGPLKKRLLTALAITVSRDDRIDSQEIELLRAIASALDCPMPLAI